MSHSYNATAEQRDNEPPAFRIFQLVRDVDLVSPVGVLCLRACQRKEPAISFVLIKKINQFIHCFFPHVLNSRNYVKPTPVSWGFISDLGVVSFSCQHPL